MQSLWRSLGIALVLGLGGCGGNIWDEEGLPAGADVEGEWTVTETITVNNCDPSREDRSYKINIALDDTSIRVYSNLEDPDPNPFTGSFDGDTLTWEGSFTEAEGTTTIEDMNLTVTDDSLTGRSEWTWTDDTNDCNGTAEVTATRTS